MSEDHAGTRLDKWLWAARFFKSRTLAVTAIEMGRVHLNNERVKPARLLRVGDKVAIQKDQIRTEVFVRFLGEVRRSAPLALLRVGDKVAIQKDQIRTEVFVRFLGEVRRSAPLAKLLYEETMESLLARQTATERKRLYAEPATNRVGRPTKRDRRALGRIEPFE